nr:hypothetical protein [Lacticaseibacillus nasuensis]
MAKSMVLISFYFEALQAMKKRLPWLNTSFLTNTYSDTDADKAATLGPNSGIDAGGYANITAEQVAYAHSKGLKFGLWTPTDDTNRASWQAMGVDYVTTNSKSGDLRWGAITLTGGWTASANARLARPFVEQVNLRTAHIVLNITGGDGAKGNYVGNLPDWAVPLNDYWSPATVRTSSSVTLGGIDIRGASSGSGLAGGLQAGYNLDQMPTGSNGWVNFDVTYSL